IGIDDLCVCAIRVDVEHVRVSIKHIDVQRIGIQHVYVETISVRIDVEHVRIRVQHVHVRVDIESVEHVRHIDVENIQRLRIRTI
ncbi:hypothetical protein IFU40_16615, partial [Microbacterium sp. CFBP 13617]|uniref:hypothetical protein n=1 Tax=Microbacterium sp. CFBP 13617 TaxID=2774035 RepID=UPI001787324C